MSQKMFPVYKYLDSYPQPTHQRYHTPYPHHYPPWEGVPPRTPENYEPWPYPNSAECHGCCGHGYPSGFYNYRPPLSHLPPHPGYFHGAYPPYPDSYPAYFFPPHYSTAQPQYEYDKNVPRYHCCECPNHSHFPKNESSVKFEEQKPETENKKDYDDSSSAIKFPNNPLAWFPPGYMKDREVNKQQEEPKFRNGWIPLEMNCNRLPKTGGEEERNRRSGEEKKTQFPLPIIWMPGYNKPEESEKKELKEINLDPGDAKDSPKLKFIPLKLLEKNNHEDEPNLTEVPGDKEKVKEEAPKNMENAAVADKEKKIKSIPVKQVEENEKANENGDKKPSSPAKISKLPPVCLRVDPLPGKKTKVGKSRSPSPPGEKERAQHAHLFDSKLQKQVAEDTKQEGLENKVTTNTEKVDKKDENLAKVRVEVPVVSMQDDSKKTVKEGENQIPVVFKDVSDKTATEKEDQRVTVKEDVTVVEVAKGQTVVGKKKITSEEAAILIQSAYRGFEVRRLEPLKKLKQIAKVQEQVGGIREGISSLEASAERRKDKKQRLVISETIMGLLLQLDTIQGLHSSVREVRKAVARELVFLQEKLDSLSTDEEPQSTVVKDIIDNSAEDNNQTVFVCGSVPEGLSCKTEEFAEPPLARDEKPDSEVEVVAELPVLEDEKSQSNSEETAKLSVLNAESEFAEQPLVRDEKLDSKVEVVEQLPVSEDGKLHSNSVESSELSVENLESAGSETEEFANSLVKDEEPISKVEESIELPLLEDEKAEPELEELLSPSLVKDEPMEQVEPESEPDELLQPRFVKGENVEEPESQPEKSAEQVEPESEPDELQTYVNDETVVNKDEIVELPVSQPEESAEPQSNPKELMDPESELEHPSVEIDENLEGPEPRIKESVLVEDANVNSEPDKSAGLSVEGDENAYSDIVGFSETSVNGDRGFARKEFPTLEKEIEHTEQFPTLEKEIDHTEHDSLDMTNGRISQSVTGAVDGEKIEIGANRISESMISMMEGEETETRETEVAELGKSATDSDMEAIESYSTEEVVGNGNIESKSATNFTAQTFEISPHSCTATENSDENRVTVDTAEDKSPVEVEENLQVDFEVAEEVSSRAVIKDGDFQERRKGEHKLEEENETLKEMVEILVEAGKKQLNAITDLSERVRDLEKRLIKKKQKVRRRKVKGSSCSRVVSNLVKESSSSSHLC